MSRVEKFLKTIWAINGVVFLVIVWFSIYPHIHAMFRPRPKPRRPDTNQDGQLTEADFDLLKRLNVNTGDLTDIVDADLVRRVQEIAFQ